MLLWSLSGAFAQGPRDLLAEIETGSNLLSEPVIPHLDETTVLPSVVLDGAPVHIHVQGLFVTGKHFIVTGRLERSPKRALFMRFDRHDPTDFEVLDITPTSPAGVAEILDHPGGFDFDGTHFWIPVAISRAKSHTAIVKLTHAPNLPLAQQSHEVAFRVHDHIGAIACRDDAIYGATWDTKHVLIWNDDGKMTRRIAQSSFVRNDAQWRLAVQDWKFERDFLFAAGLEKSPVGAPAKAIIDVLRPMAMVRVGRIELPNMDGVTRPVTNEGMAWHAGRLFLLPEDLGRGAKVLQFSFH
jgi:hypothetical protein